MSPAGRRGRGLEWRREGCRGRGRSAALGPGRRATGTGDAAGVGSCTRAGTPEGGGARRVGRAAGEGVRPTGAADAAAQPGARAGSTRSGPAPDGRARRRLPGSDQGAGPGEGLGEDAEGARGSSGPPPSSLSPAASLPFSSRSGTSRRTPGRRLPEGAGRGCPGGTPSRSRGSRSRVVASPFPGGIWGGEGTGSGEVRELGLGREEGGDDGDVEGIGPGVTGLFSVLTPTPVREPRGPIRIETETSSSLLPPRLRVSDSGVRAVPLVRRGPPWVGEEAPCVGKRTGLAPGRPLRP